MCGPGLEMELMMENDKLTNEQQKELEKIIKEITDDAKSVVDDYVKNPPVISGSAEIHIHEESPWLDENQEFIPLTKKRKKNAN